VLSGGAAGRAVQVQKVLLITVQQLLSLAGAARRAVQVQKVLQVVQVAVQQVLQSVVVVQALGRAAVHAVKCCRVLLLSRPWGELLSMLSGAAECCCCPSAVQQLQVLQVLSSKLGFGARGVLLDMICCWRGV
jgi:hypothetical protein